jgi:hypothetical protein
VRGGRKRKYKEKGVVKTGGTVISMRRSFSSCVAALKDARCRTRDKERTRKKEHSTKARGSGRSDAEACSVESVPRLANVPCQNPFCLPLGASLG